MEVEIPIFKKYPYPKFIDVGCIQKDLVQFSKEV